MNHIAIKDGIHCERTKDDQILSTRASWKGPLKPQSPKSNRYIDAQTNDDMGEVNDTYLKRNHHEDVTRLSPYYNSSDCFSVDAIPDYEVKFNNQSGAFYNQTFSPGAILSPSSSVMYRRNAVDACSPSSSRTTIMLDDEYFGTANIIGTGRESILMKKAMKSSKENKKRRESIGECISLMGKRPNTISVAPRLTKSSNFFKENLYHNSGINISNQRRRHHSWQQHISQKHQNELAHLLHERENGDCKKTLDTNTEAHWDPHIDAFEILRAKITGITRSMQEFHVKELFKDEKRRSKKITATTSSPLTTTTNKVNRNARRLSLNNSINLIGTDDDVYNQELHFRYQRMRSQSSSTSYNNDSSDDENEGDEDGIQMTSPNLTTLFFTTNNLINSRLDELSETTSMQSSHDDVNEIMSKLEWKEDFLDLVTNCIQQSEQLESLSTDLLSTEHRVRELLLISGTIHEQFREREKQYEDRIKECQEVAIQQLVMIDSLEELNADINMKIECRKREADRQEAILALNAKYNCDRDSGKLCYVDNDKHVGRWDFQESIGDLLSIDDKFDKIQKMRWDIGMFVGGGVGTGHIIHSFEEKLNSIDVIIAGTGTTSSETHLNYPNISGNEHYQSDKRNVDQSESYFVTPSINQHIKINQHQYVLYLNKEDKKSRFSLLPKRLWIPDRDSNRCQFQVASNNKRCTTHFSLFERKHHCRKCGKIMCQKHSGNRLPLFSVKKKTFVAHWSRVCDNCFHSLIMNK